MRFGTVAQNAGEPGMTAVMTDALISGRAFQRTVRLRVITEQHPYFAVRI